MEGATPFPRRPIPVFGESIYGFDRRFAACARFDRLDAFRQATGLLDVGPRSVRSKFERLAMLAGQPASALDHMRWSPTKSAGGHSVVSLLGHDVREAYLRSDRLRFCPSCLDEDGSPEQRIHRQAWQVLQICACPRHRTLLVEACDECGEPFRQIRKTRLWSCPCGREMIAVRTTPAPSGAVGMSLAFMRRLGAASGDLPDHVDVFPQSFECMGLDDLLTVSARIGDLAVTPAAEDDPVTPKDKIYQRGPVIDYHITVERAALIMDAAHAIMLDWPPSADRLFESVADRNPDPAPEHPVRRIFATRLGYHLLSPMRSVDGSDIRIIHGALEDWLHRERGIYLDGRRRPKVQAAGDILIDVADAIRRLEGRMINPSSLRFWADAGAIEMVGRKVRLSSVDRTVARLESLGVHEFHDPIPVEAWSGPSLYSDRYRRSDALRDLLSGRIRATRALPGEGQGLAGLMISRSDLVARIPERSGGQMRPLRVRLTAQEIRARRLSRRMKAALENDFFTNPARVHELIAALWPTVRPLNVVGEKVRCNYIVSEYGGRRCPRRLYSVADAIGLMTERHGPPVV